MKAVNLILAYIAGIIVVPVILAFTPRDAKRLRVLDGVYGNSQDGLGGDFGINPAITMPANAFTRRFPRFYWLAIRNPAHNLGWRYGAHGIIDQVWRNRDDAHAAHIYRSWMVIAGRKHLFYYGHIKFGPKYIRYAYGPKLWPLNPRVLDAGDVEFNGKYRSFWRPGDRIDAGFAMSIALRSGIS